MERTTGIRVEADDVTIDLGEHAIRYSGEPKEGTLGIAAPGRRGVTISNGTIGGFWFNIHCTQNERLRIRNVLFDDIPYIGINVAQSKDVEICDNRFENFRYDLPKEKSSTFVIGINIGADGAVIANNHFHARPQSGAAKDIDLETVFVLFSAEVTKDSIVASNKMTASDVLPRSYGVWVATNAQASIVDNRIRNMKYGVCLASDASALVCLNSFDAAAQSDASIETVGISAAGAKEIIEAKNSFGALTTPAVLPQDEKPRQVSRG